MSLDNPSIRLSWFHIYGDFCFLVLLLLSNVATRIVAAERSPDRPPGSRETRCVAKHEAVL